MVKPVYEKTTTKDYSAGFAMAARFEMRAIKEFAPATYTALDYVQSAYDADLLRILSEGYKVSGSTDTIRIRLHKTDWKIATNISLIINFDALKMLAPNERHCQLTGVIPKDVLAHWDAMLEIHEKWNNVRQVLTWFNEHNVTLGAARYYWPAILALLPENGMLLQCTGQRYKEVEGISEVIPLMRETSTTIATMKLLPPEDKSRAAFLEPTMQLSFDDHSTWFTIE